MLIQFLNFLEINLRKPTIIIALSLLILILYLSPLFIYGENLHIMVYDNLNSNVIWMKILAHSGMIFADSNAIIPNMMGGLPRHSYGSEFNVLLWLYYFFAPFTAYVINEVLMHVVAFGTMWLLLSQHFVKPKRGNILYIATGALYFALLPHWHGGGLSLPLMPLAVYALLNIREGSATWKEWTMLMLIPLYSNFVIIYFFFLLFAGTFWIIDSIKKQAWQWSFIGAIVWMGLIFLLVEYRLVFATFFDTGFISHRSEFSSIFRNSLEISYQNGILNFLNGHPLAKGNHYLFLLPLTLLALLLGLKQTRLTKMETLVVLSLFGLMYLEGIWDKLFTSYYFFPLVILFLTVYIGRYRYQDTRIAITLLLLILISLWGGMWFYTGWKVIQPFLPFLQMFNMSRFSFIEPFIWSLLAVFVFIVLAKKVHFPAFLTVAFWIGVSYIAMYNATFMIPIKGQTTYKEYYAMEQFSQIRDYIGKKQSTYRIASLGIEPAVSLYNGFYTIDGYSVNYPLEYKHRFEKIFEKEIPKNSYLHFIFQTWGNKCYVFTRAVNYDQPNTTDNFKNLELNASAMLELGAQFMVTPVPITNPAKGFVFARSFIGQTETMYLYRLVK